MTLAIFKLLRTIPEVKEILNIISRGLATISLTNFKICVAILRGPLVLLEFNLEIFISISLAVIGKRKRLKNWSFQIVNWRFISFRYGL